MAEYDQNILLDSEFTYQQYAPPVTPVTTITNIGDSVSIVTTINGATGPITLTSSIGFVFSGSAGGTVTMSVDNPALARSAMNAAESGANSDINSFSALTGNNSV